MKFNDMPKYKKLAMYMQLKECVHDQFFDITDKHDIANLEKLGIVFSIKDIDSLQKSHFEYLQKREISSLLQYLRRNGYAKTNGAGLWNLTNDGGCIAEDGWDRIDEDCNDIAYSFWPEDFQPNAQPSAPTQNSNISDIVKSLENKLSLVEEDLKHARFEIAELESENAKLKAKLQLANNNYTHQHNSTEYAELVDRAVRLVSDVVRSFK